MDFVVMALEAIKELRAEKSREVGELKAYLCAKDPEAPFCAAGPP